MMIYNIKLIKHVFRFLLMVFLCTQPLLGSEPETKITLTPRPYSSQEDLSGNNNQASITTNTANFLTTESSQTNSNNLYSNQSYPSNISTNINESSYIDRIPNNATRQPPTYEEVILQHNTTSVSPYYIVTRGQPSYSYQRNIGNRTDKILIIAIISICATAIIIVIIYLIILLDGIDENNHTQNNTLYFPENNNHDLTTQLE